MSTPTKDFLISELDQIKADIGAQNQAAADAISAATTKAAEASDSADGASEARDKSEEWAESEGQEPGGAGTKSSKEWAAVSEGHADTATEKASEISDDADQIATDKGIITAAAQAISDDADQIAQDKTAVEGFKADAETAEGIATTKAGEAAASAIVAGDAEDGAVAQTALQQGIRDTTEGYMDRAEAADANIQSNTVYQDLTAINELLGITAVAACFADTTKDDNPDWIHQVEGLSYMTETLGTATRGLRRKPPKYGLITAEASKVTWWDIGGPVPEMWMVLNWVAASLTPQLWRSARAATSVGYRNGVIAIGIGVDGNGGLIGLDLIKDDCSRITTNGNYSGLKIVDRNRADLPALISSSSEWLSHWQVNTLRLTFEPGAPYTTLGMREPTIIAGVGVAGAAGGGTNIIRPDGSVVDIPANLGAGGYMTASLDVDRDGRLVTSQSYNRTFPYLHVFDRLPAADLASASTYPSARNYSVAATVLSLRGKTGSQPKLDHLKAADHNILLGFNDGSTPLLSCLRENPSDQASGSVAYVTDEINTGHMVGETVLATLCDTEAGSVSGAELVTNGDFATNDLTGFTDNSVGTGSVDASSGAAVITSTDNSNYGRFDLDLTGLVVGQLYKVTFDISGPNNCYHTGSVNGNYGSGTSPSLLFTAPAATRNLRWQAVANNGTTTIDNISVTRVIQDHSVRQNHLTPVGTLTKTDAVTGSAMKAWGGFSTSNYIEQDYNADLDFGTGDFVIMGWFTQGPTPASMLFSRAADPSAEEDSLSLYVGGTGLLHLRYANPAGAITTNLNSGTVSYNDGVDEWVRFAVVRRGGKIEFYKNGQLANNTGVPGPDLAGTTSPVVRIGRSASSLLSSNVWTTGGAGSSIAMFRIGKTAPSADQISFAYEQERHLFKEDALAVLGGTGAITGIEHNYKKRLSFVAQADGVTLMQEGFIPVGFIAGDFTNDILAEDMRMLEMGASDALFKQDAINLREEVAPDHSTAPNRIEIEHEFNGTETTVEMPKGYKPLRVWLDGGLEREGSGNDYTVEWTGFRYQLTWASAPAGTSYAQIELEQIR